MERGQESSLSPGMDPIIPLKDKQKKGSGVSELKQV